LLPVCSFALTSNTQPWLVGTTVLGRRRVKADTAIASRITIPGRGYSSYVLALRDARFRALIVVGTGMWHSRHFDDVAGYSFPDPAQRTSAIKRYVIGLAVIAAWVASGLAAIGLFGVALGLFRP
jgi:hypothetical protein